MTVRELLKSHGLDNTLDNSDELLLKLAQDRDVLLAALKHSEQAFASLPFDALGMSHDDHCEWPLRDELLTQIRAAIAQAEAK